MNHSSVSLLVLRGLALYTGTELARALPGVGGKSTPRSRPGTLSLRVLCHVGGWERRGVKRTVGGRPGNSSPSSIILLLSINPCFATFLPDRFHILEPNFFLVADLLKAVLVEDGRKNQTRFANDESVHPHAEMLMLAHK